MEIAGLVILVLVILVVATVLTKAVALVPQAEAAVIERLGRYTRTVSGQLTLLVPFIDRIRARVDVRERVVSFQPQPVITEDNLTLSIDTVVYFRVTDPRSAVYEIDNYIEGVEQLAMTTLRNVVGGMTLEETLTSRDSINEQLRGVLDEATGRWGLRVARVELKSIMPPPSIQESMEKQMKADREKRATILTAEGHRESAIKTAEGQKQSEILSAEGAKQAAILGAEADRQARILRAQGDRAAQYLQAQGKAKSIEKTFAAIKSAQPTPELLAYQYLEQLPEMAKGEGSKVWVVPSDFGSALQSFAKSFGMQGDDGVFRYEAPEVAAAEFDDSDTEDWFSMATDPDVAKAVAEAEAVARKPVDSPIPGERLTRGGQRSEPEAVESAAPPAVEPLATDPGEVNPYGYGAEYQGSPGQTHLPSAPSQAQYENPPGQAYPGQRYTGQSYTGPPNPDQQDSGSQQ